MNSPGEEIDVVLIEDNSSDAELTMRALSKAVSRERVVHVDDGVKAIELIFGPEGLLSKANARLPRMILLDLKMPKVDGLEVLRRVKADARARSIPVVMLTSSKEERDISESYALGANSYLVKPVGFGEFVNSVTAAANYWININQPPVAR